MRKSAACLCEKAAALIPLTCAGSRLHVLLVQQLTLQECQRGSCTATRQRIAGRFAPRWSDFLFLKRQNHNPAGQSRLDLAWPLCLACRRCHTVFTLFFSSQPRVAITGNLRKDLNWALPSISFLKLASPGVYLDHSCPRPRPSTELQDTLKKLDRDF